MKNSEKFLAKLKELKVGDWGGLCSLCAAWDLDNCCEGIYTRDEFMDEIAEYSDEVTTFVLRGLLSAEDIEARNFTTIDGDWYYINPELGTASELKESDFAIWISDIEVAVESL